MLKEYLHGFVSLVYPELCIGCYLDSPIKGNSFCVSCLAEMPYTTHFQIPENDFTDKFYGRVKLEFGGALLNFYAGNFVQEMLHRLKYKRKKIIGEVLGNMLANEIANCSFFTKPDIIIPIPLHYKKRYKRGYNQSELIAQGISKQLDIPVFTNILIKNISSDTQTHKDRIHRNNNLIDTFKLNKEIYLKGKHILLIDDVMTTGATFEAAAQKLQEMKDIKFSFISAAITKTT